MGLRQENCCEFEASLGYKLSQEKRKGKEREGKERKGKERKGKTRCKPIRQIFPTKTHWRPRMLSWGWGC